MTNNFQWPKLRKMKYRFGHLKLVFGICLGFGDWDLRFGDSPGNS
jgi:hypothetical protein